MSIATECMIVNLHMGMWEARKLDREAGAKVAKDSGAEGDVARVNKLIIPKEALAKIQGKYSAVYNHFRLHTLPWKDNGDRLLSRKMFAYFIERHEQLVAEFKTEIEHFINVTYPPLLGAAQFRMASLFKATDYPTPDVIRGKFYAQLEIDAVTTADDFRCNLKDTDEVEKIKAQIEANLNDRIGKVQVEVWSKLAKAVEHYAERMKADGKLYDSTKDNLIELCDILPGLNITNDPNLKAMGKAIKERLGALDIADLRKDKAAKTAAAQEADDIVEQMKGFMAAFGVSADEE